MVRLDDLHPEEAAGMRAAASRFGYIDQEATPWISPPPLSESTICLVTSAALHRREDVPFRFGDSGYRLIPDDVDPNDLVQSQVSVNFDRTHYQRDMNVVLPIDRLHELHDAGEIGSVSPLHFSVQGASPDASTFEAAAADMANRMKELGVDAALLVPV
ncbi:MAG: glycine/sarcosine/betaine reductase selenoprotein B family protein [Chloroflexota bacterium]|nr:glycine/sarcosine/betaine reductase selenoprotein B family protein [Chloroflexota bacterium]